MLRILEGNSLEVTLEGIIGGFLYIRAINRKSMKK